MIEIDVNLLKKVKMKEFEALINDNESGIWHVNDNKMEKDNGQKQ